MEVSIGTMPADSGLAELCKIFHQCTGAIGKTFDDLLIMRSRIEDAGFINVHQKQYTMPNDPWRKHPVYKDAGRITEKGWPGRLEGYMYLFTRFGKLEPWGPEECQMWAAKLRNRLNKNWHIYQKDFCAWAQKPPDEPKIESQAEVKSLE